MSLEFTLLKNVSSYKIKIERLSLKMQKTLEVRLKGEIPMPKNNIKRKITKKRKKQELPRFF